jgi:hypothetical protein
MHTAFEMKKAMFRAERAGAAVDPYDVLDWDVRDRLGVVIDRPVGALGAGLMILLATAAFYDAPDKRRRSRPLYPEIYLFHAGGPWGTFIQFDFWPSHKEVFVSPDPRDLLAAINNRGITHLVLPEGNQAATTHWFKEPEAAVDRIKRCFLYDPEGGTAANETICLATSSEAVLQNYSRTLEIEAVVKRMVQTDGIPLRLRPPSDEETRHMVELTAARAVAESRPDHPTHIANSARVAKALAGAALVESYREIPITDALELFPPAA